MSDQTKIAYLENGAEVEVILKTDHGVIVRKVYVDNYGEPYSGEELEIAPRVFDAAPVERLEERVKELEAKCSELGALAASKREELAMASKDLAALSKRMERAPVLKNVLDFIEGKITHYVTLDYGRINILQAAKGGGIPQDEGDWRPDTKLLTLYGDSKGDLQWRLNQYRDGSGIDKECWPCLSLEEANKKAQSIIDGFESESEWILPSLVASAKTLALVAPDDLARRAREYQQASVKERIARAKKELTDAEEALAALTPGDPAKEAR